MNIPREMTGEKRSARFAYALWERRGRPFGSPAVDWFGAEEELRLWKSLYSVPFSSLNIEENGTLIVAHITDLNLLIAAF